MHRFVVASFVVACGGAQQGAGNEQVVLCPAGSMLDPQKKACVAMEGAKPVATDDASEGHLEQPRPHGGAIGVDVTCSFAHGWVALLPASEYPKDDEFLMQALIGFAQEPTFWQGQADYKAFEPYAAKQCGQTPTHLSAAAAGDYYLLAGEEGTFSLKGKYDKNGVRRKITVTSATNVSLAPGDLTFTWDCISCPWVVFRGDDGRDLDAFVVLANRRGSARRGSDTYLVRHVPVRGGLVSLRVVEIEREETHLDSLVLRVGGRRLVATAGALERDDGAEVELGPHTQITATYRVPRAAASHGFVDVELEATGYYDPL